MEENEFKEKHRKARSCFMDNNTSVYFIWYRGNIETAHNTFSKFYYFESGKLTSSDYGEKADGMDLNCDGGSYMN